MPKKDKNQLLEDQQAEYVIGQPVAENDQSPAVCVQGERLDEDTVVGIPLATSEAPKSDDLSASVSGLFLSTIFGALFSLAAYGCINTLVSASVIMAEPLVGSIFAVVLAVGLLVGAGASIHGIVKSCKQRTKLTDCKARLGAGNKASDFDGVVIGVPVEPAN